MKRFIHTLLLFLCVAPVVIAAPAGKSSVLDVGNRRQLFIDGRFFAVATNVELVVHPPRKTGERTLVADRRWEGHGIGSYNTAMFVDGIYHLWYTAGRNICYARSHDGIHWEKPNLGLTSYKGTKKNNIVLGHGANGIQKFSSEGMVFHDSNAPRDQRFRYATRISDEYKDTVIFSSPDGIHWRQTHDHVLTFMHPENRQHLDSQNVIFWDDRINKYVAYMRRNQFLPGVRGRGVARSESDHLGGFSQVQDSPIVLAADADDLRLDGKPVMDFYTSGAMKYPWAQDAYFMFPQAYFCYPRGALAEFPASGPPVVNAGPLDTQFAASRDGIKWERPDRRPFVPLGVKGEFDWVTARVFCGLVPSVDGREMYLYYNGSDHSHGWGRDERNKRLLRAAGLAPIEDVSLISRLVSRRDGFVSARAAYSGGEFTTPPMEFKGRELVLNVDTSATGLLRCELLGENGQPIKGCALEDCDLIHTANEIDCPVKWQGKSDLSALAGQPVRLRVVYRGVDLYAFQFR
jgi:hypothetical protein